MFFKSGKIKRLNKKIKAYKHGRRSDPAASQIVKKELNCYFSLAKIYKKLIGHKKYPFAQIAVYECYRAAAELESAEANYLLGKHLLEDAKYRLSLQHSGVLDSPINAKHAEESFKEAHAYLKAADQLQHVQAKRLRGLCYINGWGVPADKDGGFELVVSSIEMEGSWDKVPQIFAAIGLNKPEFFAAIMKRQQGK